MTKKQLQKAWKKVISETHKRPNLGERLKDKKISRLGDLLLCAQVLLDKIEAGENGTFNGMVYNRFAKTPYSQYGDEDEARLQSSADEAYEADVNFKRKPRTLSPRKFIRRL